METITQKFSIYRALATGATIAYNRIGFLFKGIVLMAVLLLLAGIIALPAMLASAAFAYKGSPVAGIIFLGIAGTLVALYLATIAATGINFLLHLYDGRHATIKELFVSPRVALNCLAVWITNSSIMVLLGLLFVGPVLYIYKAAWMPLLSMHDKALALAYLEKMLPENINFVILLMITASIGLLTIYYVAIRLMFSFFALVDKQSGVTESLGYSWRITKGNVLRLVLFAITTTIINAIGQALIIGHLITLPITLLAFVYVYRSLQGALK